MIEGPYHQVLCVVTHDGEKLYECKDSTSASLLAERLNLAYAKGHNEGYRVGRIDGYVVALTAYSNSLGDGVRTKGEGK